MPNTAHSPHTARCRPPGGDQEVVLRRTLMVSAVTFALLVIVAPVAFAQSGSAIAGVVKDSSGAVLPGVTVEAASPALIERVRTVATDAAGQYKIVDLVPGLYSVTFTLNGF